MLLDVRISSLISYPDLTVSYAVTWPREIWVRDYIDRVMNALGKFEDNQRARYLSVSPRASLTPKTDAVTIRILTDVSAMLPSSGYTRLNTVKKFFKISSRAWWHTRARATWNSALRRASKQKSKYHAVQLFQSLLHKSYASHVLYKLPCANFRSPNFPTYVCLAWPCVRCFQGALDTSITVSFDLTNRFI